MYEKSPSLQLTDENKNLKVELNEEKDRVKRREKLVADAKIYLAK